MRILFWLAVSVAMAAPTHAQSAPWQPERLTPGWTFTPGAGIGMFRDNNVTLRPGTPDRRSNWVLLVAPRGELDYNGRRSRLNLGYAGTLEAFRQVGHLNRYRQLARLGGTRTLSPRVNVRTDLSYRLSPTTDDLEDGTVPFSAVGSRLLNVSGGLSAVLSPRTNLSASYAFHQLRYDEQVVSDPQFQFLRGGHGHSPALQLSYRATPRTSIDAGYNYTHGDVLGEISRFDVHEVTAGGSYRLAQYTTIGARGGLASHHVPTLDLRGVEPVFHAYLEQQVSRTIFSLRYQQTVATSFSHGALSGTQRFRAGVETPIALGRAYASGSVTFSRTERLEGLVAGFNARTVWVNGAVGYRLTPWLSTETYISTSRQTPIRSDGMASTSRTRFGFLVVTSKPVRID